ncbi:SAM-dependent methyltransferase [Actinomadura violacea]|uniref:SAM-dependent methyltransferase n=1 Tax=Actinomadura violacea TaxID=2819934 RepID=A0ABS3RXQ8_9ACTN|nr:SAM-dependent methyltransferase [Actinomadura violacea]MBO2461535.1 SAM-dependent methyltransferase [Actinomadura violacea]
MTASSFTRAPFSPRVEIDSGVPQWDRVWNYLLHGKDCYAIDREAGDVLMGVYPQVSDMLRQARYAQVRAIQHLVRDAGIRQVLQIRPGLPGVDNTHEVAQRAAPDCRVVYVESDPLVFVHARALLTGASVGSVGHVQADVRDAETVWAGASRWLDLTRPVAVLAGGLEYLPDEQAAAVVPRLLAPLVAGSYLVVSHPTAEHGGAGWQAGADEVAALGAEPVQARSLPQVRAFFSGLDLLEPGLVTCAWWHPDLTSPWAPITTPQYMGVGRVRESAGDRQGRV